MGNETIKVTEESDESLVASLDELSINTMRFLAVDAVEKANSGHPGMPMGDALMAYVLWTEFLRHNPGNPQWEARDRFVLSAGHGSMLLYSLLHLTGYDISLDDLKSFRQYGSKTPGHPEYEPSVGIETTTGPLGQGFATGVGMAMAQKYLADRFNKPGFDLFDYNIYAITSDGDMMEGVSNEAASLAGHLGLGSIVYLYSANRITIEGSTDLAFTEDTAKRFEALGWHVQEADGKSMESIREALRSGRAEKERPSIIIARTSIGFGSPNKQDDAGSHGAPLGADEIKLTKEALGWPLEPSFHIPQEVKDHFGEAKTGGEKIEDEWKALFEAYAKEYAELSEEYAKMDVSPEGVEASGLLDNIPEFNIEDGPMATRSASGKILNAVAASAPFLIGGSADLAPSNNTHLNDFGDFSRESPGRNIHFGVREHAMGAILNGLALSGRFIPYGGTFLIFSDYMKPAVRLAALMGLHVVYVYTHDSIGLGEDGPTHQPVEQLAALRATPNLTVFRPADANETACAWRAALTHNGPSVLALSRQKLPILKSAVLGDASKGAYVVADPPPPATGTAEVIIIATGSEVHLAMDAYGVLSKESIKVRVVSMPSMEIFEAQDKEYRDSVLPPEISKRVSVEAASSLGWGRYVGLEGTSIALDRFGASAPYKDNFRELGFSIEELVSRVKAL
ncbi:MAG: transketolase [Thermodesulfobacteriota bacterium]